LRKEILEEMADGIETPSYIFDLETVKERLEMLRRVFNGTASICYAMKANPLLVGEVSGLAEFYEVCSPGEFRICERAGIPMDRIVLSGVNKEEEDIDRIINKYDGYGTFTVESKSQLTLLQQTARKHGARIEILLRVSSGNQFGCDEETIREIIAKREEYPNVSIMGLQYYSGTQKKKLTKMKEELHFLEELIVSLQADFGFITKELEYGPGFYVAYYEREQKINEEAVMNEFLRMLWSTKFGGHITLEMGRYIAATCGYYITRVADKKITNDQNYLIVDGGINHLNYYAQNMGMRIPRFLHLSETAAKEDEFPEAWTVCGSLCTSADVLVKNLPLRNPRINDILIFENAGAYSITEGIYLFLSRDLPRVFFYNDEKGIYLVRDTKRTDTINDLDRKDTDDFVIEEIKL